MVRRETFEAAGLPISMLGLGCAGWRKEDICKVLDHYNVVHASGYSKIELLRLLNDLIRRRNLTIESRFEIIKGRPYWERQPRRWYALHAPSPDLTDQAALPVGLLPTTPILSSSDVSCVICFEILTSTSTPGRRITNICDHEPLVCLGCLAQAIASQSESKIWNHIDCPTCHARLSYEDIRAFAPITVFERYVLFANCEDPTFLIGAFQL